MTIITTMIAIPIAKPKNPLGVINMFAITTLKLKDFVENSHFQERFLCHTKFNGMKPKKIPASTNITSEPIIIPVV